MLFAVRRWISFVFSSIACATVIFAQQPSQTPTQQGQPPASQSPQASPQQQPAPAIPLPGPPQTLLPHFGPSIVIDPAHGGTDPGARGAAGLMEKELTLSFARFAKLELERQGFRVFLTRNDDSNPSYDDRAATANVHRDAIFITLHVASTGAFGTARTYFNQFAEPLPVAQPTSEPATNALSWEDAQRSYLDVSHRFADILQSQLAPRFQGSPLAATGVAVRELRSIAAPAVAIEISSVVTSDPESLRQRAGPLAAAIVAAVRIYRPIGGAASSGAGGE